MATMSVLPTLTPPKEGEVGPISVELIRPFKNQPRKFFDSQSLQDLAASILSEGQRTPAWVMPVDGGYELIAGERRLRACKLLGIPFLICEVRSPSTIEAQYLDSVMENFGRKDCTIMESILAVKEVVRIKFGDNDKGWGQHVNEVVAKVFAVSKMWVAQRRALATLHPKVLAYLDEPQQLNTQVAYALCALRPEIQVLTADAIIANQMKYRTALEYVRSRSFKSELRRESAHTGIRSRRPCDDFVMLANFLKLLGEKSEEVKMMGPRFSEMFKYRQPEDRNRIGKIIDKRIQELQDIKVLLGK